MMRIHALDGLRGMAICLVLAWHTVFMSGLPNHPYLERAIQLGRLSWSGVDLFFVLSGFLIAGGLLDTVKEQRYFAPFYLRRAHRIVPLYAVVLLLVFAATSLGHHLGASGTWTESRIPLLYYPAFLQNVWIAGHGNFGSYTLGVTWSLAVEEQFYLTLPLIIRFVSRSALWWIVVGMIAGAPLLRVLLFLSIHSPTTSAIASYVLMPCRADALGWGIVAALIRSTPTLWAKALRLRVYLYFSFGAVAAITGAVLLSGFMPFTSKAFGLEYSLLAALYFLLLLNVLVDPKIASVFSGRALRYMGTVAYGLYLLHNPLIAVAHDIAAHFHPQPSGWLSLFGSASAIALTIVLAAISWKYLEKPMIKRGHQLADYVPVHKMVTS